MTTMSRWFVPVVGIVLGLLIAAAELGRNASPWEAVVSFAIVAGYALALRAFQSRSDMASVLSGLPRDERWSSINVRALSIAAQVMAIVLVGGFLVAQVSGGDADTYARLGAIFAVAYLGGLGWYRWRS
jgi:precorrin-3B methylase